MDDKINIKKIAELSGVSTATVSRIINKNGRFSKETEGRVRKIIEQYNYIPNAGAKGLRTKRTPIVGIVVPDITNNYFASLVLEIEGCLFEAGYSSLICNTNESPHLEERHLWSLISQNVCGIINISGNGYAGITGVKNIPVIYLDRRSKKIGENEVLIESDNENGGYMAGCHLLDAGSLRPAIFTASEDVDYNHFLRYKGFMRAMAQHGIKEEQIVHLNSDRVSIEEGRVYVSRALEQGIVFDGLECTADPLAAGAYTALHNKGFRVPEDILLMGFDNSNLSEVVGNGLTSIRQDVKAMARLAVTVLLQFERGEKPEEYYYRIPVTLVRRNSTGCLPT